MTPPALFIVITPALSPALSPALTPAETPALSPALTPALSPALTPALSPALLPALLPAETPALLFRKHLYCDRLSDHGTQRKARSPYIKQHVMLTVNDMHISTFTHAHRPQLTCICHGVTDIDNSGMTPNGT